MNSEQYFQSRAIAPAEGGRDCPPFRRQIVQAHLAQLQARDFGERVDAASEAIVAHSTTCPRCAAVAAAADIIHEQHPCKVVVPLMISLLGSGRPMMTALAEVISALLDRGLLPGDKESTTAPQAAAVLAVEGKASDSLYVQLGFPAASRHRIRRILHQEQLCNKSVAAARETRSGSGPLKISPELTLSDMLDIYLASMQSVPGADE